MREAKETKKSLLLFVFALGIFLTYLISLFLPLPYTKKGVINKNTTLDDGLDTTTPLDKVVMVGTHIATGSDKSSSIDRMLTAIQDKNGDAFDKAFLTQMIIHHEGAVAMAKEALAKSHNKEILALSAQIVEVQQAEIKEMKLWQKGVK